MTKLFSKLALLAGQRRLAIAVSGVLLSSVALGAGDAARGETEFETCLGCHGVASYTNVYPTYRVPRLAGQNSNYLESALKAYRSGARKHATMQAQAGSLSDQDIADIATYLSGLK